jgi:hypothetical protein
VVHAHPNWETGENPDSTYSPIDGWPPGGWSPNKKLRIDEQRINRVGDHCAADAKIVSRDGIADPIACLVKRWWNNRSAIPDRLFNRVDTYVHCADLTP